MADGIPPKIESLWEKNLHDWPFMDFPMSQIQLDFASQPLTSFHTRLGFCWLQVVSPSCP
jgi:hypothetical protein